MGKSICHITSIHSRYDIRIFMKECKSLAIHGYDVTLIVNDDKEDEIMDGVKIVSTNFNPINRIDRFLNSNSKLLKKAIKVDAEIYHLHDPDLLPLGNKLKRLGKKVIFDSHEDVPQQIKDKRWIPKVIRNTISKLYELYEKISIKKYDGVISVTPHIVDRLKQINPNTAMITNYPIIDKDEKITRTPENAICFAGGVKGQYRHHNILKAIEDINGLKYIIAGTGRESYFERLKALPAWEKVEYIGKIPPWEVKDIYLRSMAGMAIHKSTQLGKRGSYGIIKLFEFMEAKLPVICSNYTLWEEIINKYKCGICVDPDNVDEIKKAIEYIIDNPVEARRMGENGRRTVVEKYNWRTQEKMLVEIYKEIWLSKL